MRKLVVDGLFYKQKYYQGQIIYDAFALQPATLLNTPPCVFFTCFKLCKYYQIAQSASYEELLGISIDTQ